MSENDWQKRFGEIYDRAIKAYDRDGLRLPNECVSAPDRAFLATIGCSAQEVFDFAEDWCVARAPSFNEALAVTSIRRDYFLSVQSARASNTTQRENQFPSRSAEIAGIAWFPRILAKARAKLRGELPDELMFGCGGDRRFLDSVGVGMAEFLSAVRTAEDDDQPVIDLVKGRMRRQ